MSPPRSEAKPPKRLPGGSSRPRHDDAFNSPNSLTYRLTRERDPRAVQRSGDELLCDVRDVLPPVVDDQRVAAVGDDRDLGDRVVLGLQFEGCLLDRRWSGRIVVPGDDQHGPSVGALVVGVRLGPWMG